MRRRGGARPGSGRPLRRGPTVSKTFRLKVGTAEWIAAESTRNNITGGDLIDRLVEREIEKQNQ
jgi:hypothetical protein